MMRKSLFPWSTVHVMNIYIYHLCICEYDTNRPKENVPPPLPLTYSKIYPKIVPGIISYYNTPHFNILFIDAVHT